MSQASVVMEKAWGLGEPGISGKSSVTFGACAEWETQVLLRTFSPWPQDI